MTNAQSITAEGSEGLIAALRCRLWICRGRGNPPLHRQVLQTDSSRLLRTWFTLAHQHCRPRKRIPSVQRRDVSLPCRFVKRDGGRVESEDGQEDLVHLGLVRDALQRCEQRLAAASSLSVGSDLHLVAGRPQAQKKFSCC